MKRDPRDFLARSAPWPRAHADRAGSAGSSAGRLAFANPGSTAIAVVVSAHAFLPPRTSGRTRRGAATGHAIDPVRSAVPSARSCPAFRAPRRGWRRGAYIVSGHASSRLTPDPNRHPGRHRHPLPQSATISGRPGIVTSPTSRARGVVFAASVAPGLPFRRLRFYNLPRRCVSYQFDFRALARSPQLGGPSAPPRGSPSCPGPPWSIYFRDRRSWPSGCGVRMSHGKPP